ncbi:MAG: hypothetical protein ISR34_11005 [Pirellulales bacterium]|nr:hypothetical protein [Pirellulales bacterium]
MMVNADHDDEMVNEDQSETEAHEASTALARSPAGNAFAAAGKGGKTTQTKIKKGAATGRGRRCSSVNRNAGRATPGARGCMDGVDVKQAIRTHRQWLSKSQPHPGRVPEIRDNLPAGTVDMGA